MATNVEKLPKTILDGVRERLQGNSVDFLAADAKINDMTPLQILEEWSAWEFGTKYWAGVFINTYESLKS